MILISSDCCACLVLEEEEGEDEGTGDDKIA